MLSLFILFSFTVLEKLLNNSVGTSLMRKS